MARTKEAPVRLDDDQLLTLAARYEKAQQLAGRLEKMKKELSDQVIAELQLRKVTCLEGEDATISLVQAVSWDAAALYEACPDELRSALFADEVDLNALPADLRAELVGLLDADQAAAVTRHRLDPDALKAAIAKKRICEPVLRRGRKLGAAYIRVSHGGPKRRR